MSENIATSQDFFKEIIKAAVREVLAEWEEHAANAPPSVSADNTVFTPAEAAEYIGCSRESVYRSIREKKIPVRRIRKKIMIVKTELDRVLDEGGI